ncbi:MAG: hypothetical protein WA933_16665 [Microcoleaceae cyanobacterium]
MNTDPLSTEPVQTRIIELYQQKLSVVVECILFRRYCDRDRVSIGRIAKHLSSSVYRT